MSGLRAHPYFDPRSRQRFVLAIAGLCLALLAMLSVAQVAHIHQNAADADHCPLCIVMHTAAPATIAVVAVILVQLGSLEPVAEPVFVLRKRQTRLFIRPPPAGC